MLNGHLLHVYMGKGKMYTLGRATQKRRICCIHTVAAAHPITRLIHLPPHVAMELELHRIYLPPREERRHIKSALTAHNVNPLPNATVVGMGSASFGGDLIEKMGKIFRNGSGDRNLKIDRVGSTAESRVLSHC